MKFILLVLVLLAVAWLFWGRRPAPRERDAAAPGGKPEKMVTCAQCGLHVPHSEAIEVAGRHYCCDEHRQRDSGRP